ncbi:hypothetical protein C1646_746004 [Rhizophagus diaphanus]|nr:hypothetical protein C1646_746004 [Rhizophagus diaphanus] [Rhizophagus sp. MUCL 43196]
MMDEWIVKRNNLQGKNELLEEREKIITSEVGNELGRDAQALDDKIEMITSEIVYINAKIEMITSEIAYINAKIHSLQSNIAAEQGEKSAENSKESKDKSRKNSIKYAILESFFKDIIDLRIRDWSRQMTLELQEKIIMELRKTLLAMRIAAVLTTSEYKKKNRELEEALRLDQAYAEVEAEISGTSDQTGSLTRYNLCFFDDDAAYFSSSPLSTMNTGNNRVNFSRPPILPGG